MVSPINDDPEAAIEFAPKPQSVEDPDLPKAIPTPATEFTPKGRIIDDSARGTIFWEVERDEETEEEDDEQSTRSDQEPETASKAWGKPFKIEWLSTVRLPFYRTRGLRNPWNSNREIKIARDGTELETSVGRRLVGLFHRVPSPAASQFPSGTLPIMAYPKMRQL
jgi:YT521-B-like domain